MVIGEDVEWCKAFDRLGPMINLDNAARLLRASMFGLALRISLLHVLVLWSSSAGYAAPILSNPAEGVLGLVAQDASGLDNIDGLAFDSLGNLFGALEIDKDGGGNPQGGVVYVDKVTGTVASLISNIDRADQIAYDSTTSTPTNAVFFVTSESRDPASTTDRLFRIEISYNLGVPQAATSQSLTTSAALLGLEGLVVLEEDASSYGAAGDVLVSEDAPFAPPHKIAHVAADGTVTVLTPNADPANDLSRPEGMAFGDFGGAALPGLYAAETSLDRVVRVDPAGSVTVLGDPATFGLNSPDNVEFGPDGYLRFRRSQFR